MHDPCDRIVPVSEKQRPLPRALSFGRLSTSPDHFSSAAVREETSEVQGVIKSQVGGFSTATAPS